MTTTTDSWDRVVGDTNDIVDTTCGGLASLPIGATVEAHVWRTTAPVSVATLAATVVDAAAKTVRVQLGTWINTAAPGDWRLEVQVTGTWSDGGVGPRTFPSAGGRPLRLRAQGG